MRVKSECSYFLCARIGCCYRFSMLPIGNVYMHTSWSMHIHCHGASAVVIF